MESGKRVMESGKRDNLGLKEQRKKAVLQEEREKKRAAEVQRKQVLKEQRKKVLQEEREKKRASEGPMEGPIEKKVSWFEIEWDKIALKEEKVVLQEREIEKIEKNRDRQKLVVSIKSLTDQGIVDIQRTNLHDPKNGYHLVRVVVLTTQGGYRTVQTIPVHVTGFLLDSDSVGRVIMDTVDVLKDMLHESPPQGSYKDYYFPCVPRNVREAERILAREKVSKSVNPKAPPLAQVSKIDSFLVYLRVNSESPSSCRPESNSVELNRIKKEEYTEDELEDVVANEEASYRRASKPSESDVIFDFLLAQPSKIFQIRYGKWIGFETFTVFV